jgi:hypothetical protein
MVDRAKEHVELRYGSADKGGWADWMPVALVGQAKRRVFPVKFLVDREDPRVASMTADTVRELDFYLLQKGEANPWRYAQYHCTTAANIYSTVHWAFIRAGSKRLGDGNGSLLPGARVLGYVAVVVKKRTYPRLGTPRSVAHVRLPYLRWDGDVGPWSDHFGKGHAQVRSLDGSPPLRSCNEVEVTKILRRQREHAFWVTAFPPTRVPEIWRDWVLPFAHVPPWLRRIDDAARKYMAAPRGGIPDVVAWNTSDPKKSALFVECKGPKEGFSEAQEDWLCLAIRGGLLEQQFAVSVRPF